MQVWRIEHASVRHDPSLYGRGAAHFIGPFRNSDAIGGTAGANLYIEAADIDWYHFNLFPCPEQDGLEFHSWMLCGCVSPEQLAAWFCHEAGLAAMEAHGFVARAYDVPEIAVQVGKHQCVWSADLCREHVAEMRPTELLKYAPAA